MTNKIVKASDDELEQVSGGTILPYRVQAGDCLSDIATRFHVNVEDLARWNNIKDPSMILIGQELKVKY